VHRLLHPRTIAVVGASDRPESYSSETLLNLARVGFAGEVWGVNPGRESAHGVPCFPSLADLPAAPDAVVVAIPAAGVPAVVEEAGALGCGGAVVYAAGFGETPDGVALEAELRAAAARHDLPVCGPNCDGLIALHARAALWGDALAAPRPGPVALVSQSGNLVVNALATRRGLRLHTAVSSGNEAVVTTPDWVEALAREEGVRSIALLIEADGDGARLCEALAVCADEHDLLELAKALAVRRPPRAPGGTAILTCSGGDSGLGADEAARVGLPLPPLGPETVATLRARLPAAATVANPLDYTAMIWGEVDTLRELIRTVGEDSAIGQTLIFYDRPPGIAGASLASWEAVEQGILAGAAVSPVPVLVAATLPELLDDEAAWRFCEAGIPAVAGLRTGIAVAAALSAPAPDPARLRAIAANTVSARAGRWLAEHEAKDLLRLRGVPVVRGRLASREDDAVAIWRDLGGPVALKVSAPEMRHKTANGALALDVRDEAGVRAAYQRLVVAFRRIAPRNDHAALNAAVLVETMAPPGVELLMSVRRDAVVPALVIGLGGIHVETLDAVEILPLPLDPERLRAAVTRLGAPPHAADLAAQIAAAADGLALLECNPVLIHSDGAVVVDAIAKEVVK
jgi:acyl-CoA synthetase (NDP forming)